MATQFSDSGADDLAVDLFGILTSGVDLTVPDVDFSDPQFNWEEDANNPIFQTLSRLTNQDLTEGIICGSGTFDVLMKSYLAHLNVEYEKGRISGEQYARVYQELTSAAMSQAVQYLLGRDQAYWSAVATQQQAKLAEVQAIQARVQIATAKFGAATAKAQLEQNKAAYALTKLQLASEDARYDLLITQDAEAEYSLTNILPKQASLLTAQTDQVSAQTNKIISDKESVDYSNQFILPAQKLSIESETAIKTYQVQNTLPKQVANIEADTLMKTFQKDFLLPAQEELIREQMEAKRAETLNTRTDGAAVAGSIGKQKDLYTQQITSYQRDSEAKAAKMWMDHWLTHQTIFESDDIPNALNKTTLNSVMQSIKTKNNL